VLILETEKLLWKMETFKYLQKEYKIINTLTIKREKEEKRERERRKKNERKSL